MRHAVAGRKLTRTASHRLALRRNLVQSLVEHGQIRTTLPKAKEVRAFAERLVTLAIDGGLAARQRAIALLNDRAIIRAENREEYDRMSDARRERVLRARSGRRHRTGAAKASLKFTAESVIHKLFADIGPRMKRRNEARNCEGGYTRIIKLAERRLGDGGEQALLQFIGENDAPRPKLTDRTERRRRATVRYSVYAGKPRSQRAPRSRSERSRTDGARKSGKTSSAPRTTDAT